MRKHWFLLSLWSFVSLFSVRCSNNAEESTPTLLPSGDPDAYYRPADAPLDEVLEGKGDPTIPSTGEWLGFRGEEQKNSVQDPHLLDKFASIPPILWSRTLTGGYSSLAVDEGLVFTAVGRKDMEAVEAFKVQTGEKVWEFSFEAKYSKLFPSDSGVFTRAPSGPRSTPTISGEKIFFIGTMGTLFCLDKLSGKLVWKTELSSFIEDGSPPLFGYAGSPVVIDNLVIVQTGAKENTGRSIAAFAADTGELRWTSHNGSYSYSTPVMADFSDGPRLLIFSGDGLHWVVPQTGELLSTFAWETQESQNTASPVVFEDRVFISSGYGRGGALLKLGPPGSIEVEWKSKSLSSHFHAPVLHQGVLYGFSEQRLRAVEAQTGKLLWDKPGMGRGSVLLFNDILAIIDGDGDLVFAKASKEAYEELGRLPLFEQFSWTSPVLVDGILYARNEWRLFAIDLRKK